MTKTYIGLDDMTIQRIIDKLDFVNDSGNIILFGSRAKGNFKNGSDIDIAIKSKDVDFHKIMRMKSRLDELDLPYKIDLIDYNSIENIELKNHIDRVGIEFKKQGNI
ncbi:MAG: nucleotidyltransferase domain-containing protein [Campylobacterota bacterium]